MLENYVEHFNAESAVKDLMQKKSINRTAAMALLRKEVPKESYFQKKIKKALKERYPDAYIIKISQSMFSEAGVPDVMCIIGGHYFAFEIKRPILGKVSSLQDEAMKRIRIAGGTAAVVSWPEEAFKIIDNTRAWGRSI